MSTKNSNAQLQKKNDCEDLVDIRDVVINMDLDREERIKDYIRQIKNPYCYKCNGMTVQVSFSGEKTIEECLKGMIF